jgi:hypothetical protein
MSSDAKHVIIADPPTGGFVVAIRKIGADQGDAMRADIVTAVLSAIVTDLKGNLDAAAWLNAGWSELESFVEALRSGGMHPALLAWQDAKEHAGHPAPLSRERHVRRLAILLCVGLERIGFTSKRNARRFAAAELQRTGVFFDSPPTAKTLEHWQTRHHPTLTVEDEVLLGTGIAATGGDARRLAIYFCGLCHFANNPTAVVAPAIAEDG